MRTREQRRQLIAEATQLRDMGWRLKEIGEVLGADPMTLSVHMPHPLVRLDEHCLRDRRHACSGTTDHVALTTARRSKAAAKRARRAQMLYALRYPVRLDALAPSGMSIGDTIPRPADLSDPQTHLESELLNEIVGDLSVADVAYLHEDSLAALRRRLSHAGFTPGGIQRSELERLRSVAPHYDRHPD